MKNSFSTYALLFFPLLLCAQQQVQSERFSPVQQLGNEQLEIRLTLTDTAAQPFLRLDDRPRGRYLVFQDVFLQDADLVFEYRAVVQEKDFYYKIRLTQKWERGILPDPFPQKVKGQLDHIPADGKTRQVIWMDALEKDLDFGVTDTFFLTAELWGAPRVDCSQKPEFTFQQQWPHYAGVLVGAGLIIVGQNYTQQADEAYDNYVRFREEGRDESIALPFLQDARDYDRTYRNLTTAGITVIGLDALWMGYRWLRHQKRMSRYNRYCLSSEKGITLAPLLHGQEGVKVVWRF